MLPGGEISTVQGMGIGSGIQAAGQAVCTTIEIGNSIANYIHQKEMLENELAMKLEQMGAEREFAEIDKESMLEKLSLDAKLEDVKIKGREAQGEAQVTLAEAKKNYETEVARGKEEKLTAEKSKLPAEVREGLKKYGRNGWPQGRVG